MRLGHNLMNLSRMKTIGIPSLDTLKEIHALTERLESDQSHILSPGVPHPPYLNLHANVKIFSVEKYAVAYAVHRLRVCRTKLVSPDTSGLVCQIPLLVQHRLLLFLLCLRLHSRWSYYVHLKSATQLILPSILSFVLFCYLASIEFDQHCSVCFHLF